MKPKEIHDLLLSLLCRGLGFWLLYEALPGANYNALERDIYLTFVPDKTPSPDLPHWWDLFYFALQILPAIYFILGAPPLLKWATRNGK